MAAEEPTRFNCSSIPRSKGTPYLGFDDAQSTAQNINASFIDLGDGASRGAVRGSLSTTADVTRNVFGQANIFTAGAGSASDGVMPPVINFTAGSGQVFTFPTITGQVSPGGDYYNGADGGDAFSGTTDILSSPDNPGISGIVYGHGDMTTDPPTTPYYAGKTMFLVGVFLSDQTPHGSCPRPPRFYRCGGRRHGDRFHRSVS